MSRRYIHRWLRASYLKMFDDILKAEYGAGNYYLRVEGNPVMDMSHFDKHFELRFDGPYLRYNMPGIWNIYIEVNVLIMLEINNQIYTMDDLTGLIQSSFPIQMNIFKYGPDTSGVDDGSLVGCMKLVAGSAREKLQVSNFGQVDPRLPHLQSSVEGHYTGTFNLGV